MKEQEKNQETLITRSDLEMVLRNAFIYCQSLDKKAEEITVFGESFGDLAHDTQIKADRLIAENIVESIKNWFIAIPTLVEVEGVGRINLNSQEDQEVSYYITVDPLDGSLNYKLKGETLGLPYSAIVAIFDKQSPTFKDCVIAGCVDLRTGDTWFAERGKGCFINGKRCETSKRTSADIKSGIIIGEFYYPENRQLLVNLFKDQKGWLRNPGSAAYEMSLVASGQVDAFICDRQKSHELGAAYLMVIEAGGYVCDLEEQDLSNRVYQFNSQVPVIVAATKELAQEIANRIKNFS